MNPHMKNKVVTTVNATLLEVAGAVAVVTAAAGGVLTFVMAIKWALDPVWDLRLQLLYVLVEAS